MRFDVVGTEAAIREARAAINTAVVERAGRDDSLANIREELMSSLSAPVDTGAPISRLRERPEERAAEREGHNAQTTHEGEDASMEGATADADKSDEGGNLEQPRTGRSNGT